MNKSLILIILTFMLIMNLSYVIAYSNGIWDLGALVYENISLNVATREPIVHDLFFSPDGTKLFITGENNDKVHQYNLSTPWNISTATYYNNFSVTEDSLPYGLFFNASGNRMYVVGATADLIIQYNLSSNWNITTASFQNSFDVTAQDSTPTSVFFTPTGNYMYVAGASTHFIYQYYLSTDWNISTATYTNTRYNVTTLVSPNGFFIREDGFKLYVIDSVQDTIRQHTMSTAWNVSTATYDNVEFNISNYEKDATGIFFNASGNKMFFLGTINDSIYSFDLISVLTESYNNKSLEFSSNKFNITIDTINGNVAIIPTFYYNGTAYTTGITNTTSGTNITYTKTINATEVLSALYENKSFHWFFNLSSSSFNSSLHYQNVSRMIIQQNNSNGAINTINFSCYDDSTSNLMNCTTNLIFGVYSPDYYLGGNSRTYSFENDSNTSVKWFYKYPPAVSNFTADINVTAYASGYPQKKYYYTNISLSNISIAKTLYLTSSSSGIYSSFQVITQGNQIISGAYIKVERTVEGETILVDSGYTDDAGIVTFFLNPTISYTITISKSGYATLVYTITPTQSLYTITLGETSSYFYYNGTTEGLSWAITPPSGSLNLNQTYNFTFGIYSRSENILNCSFTIRFMNGTNITSVSGCNESAPNDGGLIYTTINTTNLGAEKGIKGAYYVTIINQFNETETILIEGDAIWVWVPIHPVSGNLFGSMKAFLQDLVSSPEWGGCPTGYTLNETDLYCYCDIPGDPSCIYGDKIWNQTRDFSKIVFFFLIFAIIIAVLNASTGYDTAYPGATFIILTIIVVIMSFVNGLTGNGFFAMQGATNAVFFCGDQGYCTFAQVIDNWILAAHFMLLSAIYFLTTIRRYQST